MNKLKKQIKNLNSYLGSDLQGKALLDGIARSANELRKAKSQHCEDAALLSDRLDQVKENAKLCEQENERLVNQVELERRNAEKLRSLLKKSEGEVSRLEGELKAVELKDLQEIVDVEVVQKRLDIREFSKMFNKLRREYRVCPPMRGSHRPLGEIIDYELFDIVKDFSGHEMMKLGWFVSATAVIGFPSIVSTAPIRDAAKNKLEEGQILELLSKYVYWFRNNIGDDMASLAYTGDALQRNYLHR